MRTKTFHDRLGFVLLAGLALPVVELGILRLWVRLGLGLRPGLPGFVDTDLVVPTLLSTYVFLFLARGPGWVVKWSRQWTVANALLVALFVGFAFWLKATSVSPLAMLLFWGLVVGISITGVGVFFPFSQLVQERRWVYLLPLLLSCFSVVLLKNAFLGGWTLYSKLSIKSACFTITSLPGESTCRWFRDGHMLISYEKVSAFIGSGCSGWDSLTLMLGGLLLFSCLLSTFLSVPQVVLLWASGIAFAFGLNQLRILLLFLVAAGVGNLTGNAYTGVQVLESGFHSHIGWILYVLGFGLFFAGWHRLLKPVEVVEDNI